MLRAAYAFCGLPAFVSLSLAGSVSKYILTGLARQKAEAAKLDTDKQNIIQAISLPASMIKDELERISERQDKLSELMKSQSDEPQPLIHPIMSRRYYKEIENLRNTLCEQQVGEAREHVRDLIEKIVLTLADGREELVLGLYGDFAGILKIATEDKSMITKGI